MTDSSTVNPYVSTSNARCRSMLAFPSRTTGTRSIRRAFAPHSSAFCIECDGYERPVGRRFMGVVLCGCVVTALCIALAVPAVLSVAEAGSSRGARIVPLRSLAQRSSLFDANGNLLGRLGLQDRVDVPLSAVPEILQDAVIAVEDQSFWTNPGIDMHGTLRAALANLRTGRVEE